MATISAGVSTSHIPAMGYAMDRGRTHDEYWEPVFKGYEWSRDWMKSHTPDVIILVYNDHGSAITLDMIPTFALGCAEEYRVADEGFGPRPVPTVFGDADLSCYLAEALILDEFDVTVMNQLDVDHGLTVPLSLLFGDVDHWPCRVIPLAVNVVQFPPPTAKRCLALGRAIRRAVEAYEPDLDVQVWGTGGMSHQLQEHRAGLINQPWDNDFLERIVHEPDELSHVPHVEYLREAGSEGIELVMWFIMRGAMGDEVRELHRFYHVPASNTAVGHLVVEPVNAGATGNSR